MSAATIGEEPKNPEFQLREKPWMVALKIGVIWLLTFLALGIGVHAILTETAEVPHYFALAFGGLFLLVGFSPWPYRASLLVAVDSGYLYLPTRDRRATLCLPLSRLRQAEVKKVSNHQGSPSWTLLLDLGTDPPDAAIDDLASHSPGVVRVLNGGHGQAGLEAGARQLSALKEAAAKR